MKLTLTALFMTLFLIFSCKNEDEAPNIDKCTDKTLNFTNLEMEFGCENSKHLMSIELQNAYTIIRNNSEFQAKVTGACTDSINFGLYDLVIGMQSTNSGNDTILYELTENCESLDMLLKVTLKQNAATVVENLCYHALVPKLGDEQRLDVEIVIQ